MATFLNFDVGGRPYNSQDFSSLQNQLIDMTKIYEAYNNGGNYIVEGCAARGQAGTVWLGGKVRAVQSDSTINNTTPFPVWIVAQDNQISRVYADGQAKVAFNVFNGAWTTIAPAAGVQFIVFNSQTDIDKIRIISFITPDAVPTSGGTYTGPIDAPLVTTNGGIGGNLLPESPASDNGRYRMGLGINLSYNGSNWISKYDGGHNGSAIITSDIFGSAINFGIVPSAGSANRFLSPLDVDNSYKMTLTSAGDLSVTHNITAVNMTASNHIGAAAIDVTGQLTSNTLIVNGTNVISAINTAQTAANTAQSSANSAAAAAASAQSTANAANSAASTAQSTANAANSAASSAQSTANAANTAAANAQSTANSAQSTANTANSTANTANSNANTANTNLGVLNNKSVLCHIFSASGSYNYDTLSLYAVSPSSPGLVDTATITVSAASYARTLLLTGNIRYNSDSASNDFYAISLWTGSTSSKSVLTMGGGDQSNVNSYVKNINGLPGYGSYGNVEAVTSYTIQETYTLNAGSTVTFGCDAIYWQGGAARYGGIKLTIVAIPSTWS